MGRVLIGAGANDKWPIRQKHGPPGDILISLFHLPIVWATLIIEISQHLTVFYTSGTLLSTYYVLTNLRIKLTLLGRRHNFQHLTDKEIYTGSKLLRQTWCSKVPAKQLLVYRRQIQLVLEEVKEVFVEELAVDFNIALIFSIAHIFSMILLIIC